jgi:hypothetical protein
MSRLREVVQCLVSIEHGYFPAAAASPDLSIWFQIVQSDEN